MGVWVCGCVSVCVYENASGATRNESFPIQGRRTLEKRDDDSERKRNSEIKQTRSLDETDGAVPNVIHSKRWTVPQRRDRIGIGCRIAEPTLKQRHNGGIQMMETQFMVMLMMIVAMIISGCGSQKSDKQSHQPWRSADDD